MAVYRATDDLRGQLALAHSIGGGFGAALGYRDYDKKQRWKDFQEQIRINSEKALIEIIGQGQREGWDANRTHQEIIKRIPDAVQLETYQDMVMGGSSRTSQKAISPAMEQFRFWAAEESKAEKEERLEDARLAKEQKENAMRLINPDWRSPVKPQPQPYAPAEAGTEQPDLQFRGTGKEEKPEEQQAEMDEVDIIRELTPKKSEKKEPESVISTKSPQDILSAAQKVERVNSQIADLKKKFNLNPAEVRKLEDLLMNDEPIDRIIAYISKGAAK